MFAFTPHMHVIRVVAVALFTTLGTVGCTTGKLYYTDSTGNRTLACNVEFIGLPRVDKFAVEYALSFCAENAVAKGHHLDAEQVYLLTIDRTIPAPPCHASWDHKLAEQHYNKGLLTDQEYGYIVAYIDLGLAVVNECSSTSSLGP